MVSVVLLFLLGFMTVETITEHTLCDTPKLHVVYTLCDESDHPVINMEPCVFRRNVYGNLSVTFIPRMDLDHFYATVEVWHKSMKLLDGRYELCSGVDDEFDFCGGVKGETQVLGLYNESLQKLPFVKGIYVIKVHLFAGQKEELLFCMDFTMNIKYNP
ncbi:lymphocyte antigen 96 isoform X3 [Mixophyes fleayi]|uniref:lymphocyte antigen 96 isoform X3 n=1 Tax=Mixophyes fleayi TaxID=3061075 RepID=UPI003F4D84D2